MLSVRNVLIGVALLAIAGCGCGDTTITAPSPSVTFSVGVVLRPIELSPVVVNPRVDIFLVMDASQSFKQSTIQRPSTVGNPPIPARVDSSMIGANGGTRRTRCWTTGRWPQRRCT